MDQEAMELEERRALGRIAYALREYPADALWEVGRWEANYRRMPAEQRQLLQHLPAKIAAAREAVLHNAFFMKAMLSTFQEGAPGVPPHLATANAAADDWAAEHKQVAFADADKVRYVFKNLMRDWSDAGAAEREASYGRICKELRRVLGEPREGEQVQQVLVPGCGLARLSCEVAALGYAAQGNEFSYFLLLAASFILNFVDDARQFTVHPWLHSNCNHVCDADQLLGLEVPDVHPRDLVAGPSLLSMCAGDFVEVYSSPDMAGSFDAVATCFFIDTAHNVLDYMRIIWNVLRDGGYWVNLGPLLYHWADSHTYLEGPEMSVELSLDDVRAAAQRIGFRLLREEMVTAGYMTNKKSMLQSTYTCAFWTMVKPVPE